MSARVVQRAMARVATPGGIIRETRLLLRKGVWAITLSLGVEGYVVTHLPTGAGVSGGTCSLGAAKRLLDALHEAGPEWFADATHGQTFAEMRALGSSNDAAAVREVYQRWRDAEGRP